MQILRKPQFNLRDFLIYTFEGDQKIVVYYNGQEETFDFSGYTDDGIFDITPDILSINPFVNIKKENGELKVELVDYYSDPNKYIDKKGNVIKTQWEVV